MFLLFRLNFIYFVIVFGFFPSLHMQKKKQKGNNRKIQCTNYYYCFVRIHNCYTLRIETDSFLSKIEFPDLFIAVAFDFVQRTIVVTIIIICNNDMKREKWLTLYTVTVTEWLASLIDEDYGLRKPRHIR